MLDRLGPRGLARVLEDVLDHGRLVRLANACAIKYPGMRTQSQELQRIVTDLVKESAEKDSTLKAVYRAIQKETRPAARRWNGLSEAEQEALMASDTFLVTNGNLGRHLFLLSTAEPNGNGPQLDRMLSLAGPSGARRREAATKTPQTLARETSRLERKVAEQERKIQRLEKQLLQTRDSEKNIKKDLIKRKGELAESRMLSERLRRDLEASEAALENARQARGKTADVDSVEKLGRAVRRLVAEQKKVAHALARPAETAPARIAPSSELTLLLETVDRMRRDVDNVKRRNAKEFSEQVRRMEELRGDLRAMKKTLSRPQRRIKSQGRDARVGIFVDVQNMYYAARRMKGKLDFVALLDAAVLDRRMIHASAYVVESKEIDQSGFIAVLEKQGIEVRRKNLRVRADGSTKGDWDMELAFDIVDAAADLDVVVLVSGDGDFTSIVQRVKRIGSRVEVFGFPRNTAKSLIEAADLFQPLDRKFMIYPKRSTKARAEAPSGG